VKATYPDPLPPALVEAYCGRMSDHLEALGMGLDPWRHLLSIERIARAARAEFWEIRRADERQRDPR
jgi:hypothetical protein